MNTPYQFTHSVPVREGARPAIFLMHGLASNEHDLIQLVESLKTDFHIFSLRGPIEHAPGYAFYTFDREEEPHQHVYDKVVAVTRDFIQQAVQTFDIDVTQLYILGFNQGAAVAQGLAVAMGNELSGVLILSGYTPTFVMEQYEKRSMEGLRVFISHGEYDYTYPLLWGEASATFFTSLGAYVTFQTYPDGHGVTSDNLHDLLLFLQQPLEELS